MSEFVKLKELATVITGFPFKGNQYSDAGIRTVRGENVTEGKLRWDTVKCWNQKFEKEQDYLLKPDDIVIGMDGSKVGKNKARVKQGDLPLLLAQRVACVRAKEGNDQVFLYYLINNLRFEQYVFKTQTGSSVPHISKTQIEDYEIPKFDRSIQHKIAAALSALDDKIELNNRINAELEQMAKTLYEFWFVQFDFPDEEGKPYRSSGGKMEYNEILKREIPEGWRAGALEEVLTLEYGKPLKESYRSGEGYPVMGSNGIIGYHKEYLVKGPGIVIGRKGSAGEITYVDSDFFPIDTTYFVKNKIGSKALVHTYYLLKNINLKKVESSSAVPGLNRNVVHSFKTEIPPSEVIEEFHHIVRPFYKKMEISRKQIQQLSSLREWLLPMLMNGQVKIDSNYTSTSENLSMAAEPQASYEKVAQLNIPANKKGFAKQVLAGKIVSEFKDDPNFTDIKFQKIQFLAEHIIEVDLNLNYYYQAAGPYDNKFMHSIYNDFRKQKWFDCRNKRFILQEKQEKIEGYYQGYFSPAQGQLNKLFKLLYQTSEAEAEIIATLYAVWNNRIIEGRTVADKELIEDFYKWSDRKQQYTEEQILNGLQWLRTHQMEPKGFGKLIKKAKGKK